MSLTLPTQEIRIDTMLPMKLTQNKQKIIFYRMLLLSAFILLSLILFTTGCGGGGSSDSGIGVSPAEEEVRVVLSKLSTSINATDTASVMATFNSGVHYYKPAIPYKINYHNDVQKEMDIFLKKATKINMEFKDVAILFGSEDSASAYSLLTCTYTDLSNKEQEFSEKVKLLLERQGTWGITKFCKTDDNNAETGSNFPPSL